MEQLTYSSLADKIPYQPRVADRVLLSRLSSGGAVLIEGPKACVKTVTARRAALSEVLLDVDADARAAIDAGIPEVVLRGETPRLIDEWQVVPELWNHIRREIDARQADGQFILTGSAVPADDITRHTGAGRIARLRMRPMSLFESGHSSGAVSLGALFETPVLRATTTTLTVADLATRIAIGGWPANQVRALTPALRAMRDYVEHLCRTDINRVGETTRSRSPDGVRRVIRSLARNVATTATNKKITTDATPPGGAMKEQTTASYLDALEQLFVIENQLPWTPDLRSRARIREAEKRHFVDPSIAVAALKATPAELMTQPRFLGFLFESLVVRDLRVYAEPLDAEIFHYRDSNGLEVDAIVDAGEARWGAIEVKLGQGAVNDATNALQRFAATIDQSLCGAPRFLAVIVATGAAYTRPDGVHVIPIGALGP